MSYKLCDVCGKSCKNYKSQGGGGVCHWRTVPGKGRIKLCTNCLKKRADDENIYIESLDEKEKLEFESRSFDTEYYAKKV